MGEKKANYWGAGHKQRPLKQNEQQIVEELASFVASESSPKEARLEELRGAGVLQRVIDELIKS